MLRTSMLYRKTSSFHLLYLDETLGSFSIFFFSAARNPFHPHYYRPFICLEWNRTPDLPFPIIHHLHPIKFTERYYYGHMVSNWTIWNQDTSWMLDFRPYCHNTCLMPPWPTQVKALKFQLHHLGVHQVLA